MFEWATIPQAYFGRRFYANAHPDIGDDDNPGTQESPFLTIARALLECRAGDGDRVIANSDIFHSPAVGLYAFTENVVLNKGTTGLMGHFGVVVNSGIAIEVNDGGYIGRPLLMGATVSGDGMEVGIKLVNSIAASVVNCNWTATAGDPGQVGYELYGDPLDPNNIVIGGNGFIACRAIGGNIGGGINKTTGFKLPDFGVDANFLIDCLIAKNEVGIDIVNSATHFDHAIVNSRFYDNEIPCRQADSLHHWYLFSNFYDDIEPGLDGWGNQLPWPNEEALWTFAHPDPAPISNIGAFFANKMGTIASTSMIRNLILKNLNAKGFGVTP